MPALSSTFFLQSPVCFSWRSRMHNHTVKNKSLDLFQPVWSLASGCLVKQSTHLLFQLLFDLLQIGPEIHRHFVFGAQQSSQHSVGRHPHPFEDWLLEILPIQILNLRFQVINLKEAATETYAGRTWRGTDVGFTSLLDFLTLSSMSYRSSSTRSICLWSFRHSSWKWGVSKIESSCCLDMLLCWNLDLRF